MQGTGAAGIVNDGTTQAIITGNTCQANRSHGISSSNRSSIRTIITGNICRENGLVNNFGWGIVASWLSQDVVISSNICEGNESGGIDIDPQVIPTSTLTLLTYGVISNNICRLNRGSTAHGIALNYCKWVAITGNVCTDNTGVGIHLIGSECTVTGNISAKNDLRGIQASAVGGFGEEQGLHYFDNNFTEGNGVSGYHETDFIVGTRHGLIAGQAPQTSSLAGFYVSSSTATPALMNTTDGFMTAAPIWVPEPMRLVTLGVGITVLDAAAVIRLGVYSRRDDGFPYKLLLEAGTISGASVGDFEIVTNLVLYPGAYYFTGVPQGGAPQVAGNTGLQSPSVMAGSLAAALHFALSGWVMTGVTGALPALFSGGGSTVTNSMRVVGRLAAI